MIKTVRIFRLMSCFGIRGNCKLYEGMASHGYVLQSCNHLFETYQFEEKIKSGEQRAIFCVYPFREMDVPPDSEWTFVGRNRTHSVFRKMIAGNKNNKTAAAQSADGLPTDANRPLPSENQNSDRNRGAWAIASFPIMIYMFPYLYGKYFAGIVNVWVYTVVIALSMAGLYLTELQLMRDRAFLSGQSSQSSLDETHFRALFCFMTLSNFAQLILIVVFPLMLLFS